MSTTSVRCGCETWLSVAGTCFSLRRNELLSGQTPVCLYSTSDPFSTKRVAIMLSATLKCESPYIGTHRDLLATATPTCLGTGVVERLRAFAFGAATNKQLMRTNAATANLRIITPAPEPAIVPILSPAYIFSNEAGMISGNSGTKVVRHVSLAVHVLRQPCSNVKAIASIGPEEQCA